MTSSRVLIYLLRRDLRLSDNPIFNEIAKTFQQSQHPYTHLLPVYVFAAQQIEVSGFLSSDSERSPFPEARSGAAGFWRCGPHRATFLAESVWDLKKSLGKVGCGLEIRVGLAGQVIKDLLEAFKNQNTEVVGVWMTDEEGVEEKKEERDVREAAQNAATEFKLWTDEKYFIDEYGHPLEWKYRMTDIFQPGHPLPKVPRPTRRFHNLPEAGRAPPRSTTSITSHAFRAPTSSTLDTASVAALHHPRQSRSHRQNPSQASRALPRPCTSTQTAPRGHLCPPFSRRRKCRSRPRSAPHNKRQHEQLQRYS